MEAERIKTFNVSQHKFIAWNTPTNWDDMQIPNNAELIGPLSEITEEKAREIIGEVFIAKKLESGEVAPLIF